MGRIQLEARAFLITAVLGAAARRRAVLTSILALLALPDTASVPMIRHRVACALLYCNEFVSPRRSVPNLTRRKK